MRNMDKNNIKSQVLRIMPSAIQKVLSETINAEMWRKLEEIRIYKSGCL